MTNSISIESSEALLNAIRSNSPSQGFTHTFYKYPARFSPEFARTAIEVFTKAGDVVLDPFMGSATSLVEAIILGRHAIGSDISSLAHFVAKVKTTILTEDDISRVRRWSEALQPKLNLQQPSKPNHKWADKGYQKDLPWPIRKTIELALSEIDKLPKPEERDFARCALLRAAQWALDCTKSFPSASDFRCKFNEILQDQSVGIQHVREAIDRTRKPATVVCLNTPAVELNPALWHSQIARKPKLVVTSPPYPGVHMLYHRWQIKGRKETPAPFWIAGQNDGHGESFYTMGSRSPTGLNNYFKSIEDSFSNIHTLLANGAIVIQLIAFSHIEEQLPRYLEAMKRAGYQEVEIAMEREEAGERIWRQVPLRRWYASMKGDISSSREFLLVHKRLS